jgi:hypothetical protein
MRYSRVIAAVGLLTVFVNQDSNARVACIQFTDQEVLHTADVVVSGTVTAVTRDRFTVIDVTVDHVWKGEASKHMRIIQVFDDGPHVAATQEYLFFLHSRTAFPDLTAGYGRDDVRLLMNDCASRPLQAGHTLGEGKPLNP